MAVTLVALLLHVSLGVLPASGSSRVPAFLQAASPADVMVRGIVRDQSGAVVTGAIVFVRSPSGAERYVVTGVDGQFSLTGFPTGSFDIIVRATGFATVRQSVTSATLPALIEISLAPARQSEEVTVATTRVEQRTADVAASLNILTSADIRRSPAVVADDVLRQVPAFSLFRRTSSLAAHPATQGVSLRGIGSSGVSRTLVLMDGVPLNDPFGGWVYWSRVPLDGLDRIEVVESASSSVYGNYAMGGLINLVTAQASPRTVDVRTQYGSHRSPKLDVHASDVWGRLGASIDVNAFDTNGYPTVFSDERGPVDRRAAVTFKNVNMKFDYAVSDRVRAFLRVGHFSEQRENGKRTSFAPAVDETNATSSTSTSSGVRLRLPDASEVLVTVFIDRATFDTNYVTVPITQPVRTTARLTLQQRVPSKSAGGAVQWTRAFGVMHVLNGGLDWRWVDGESQEREFDAPTGTTPVLGRISGGTQRSVGVYVQDLITPTERTTITLGTRVDHWTNYGGHSLETNLPSGTLTANGQSFFPSRTDAVVSPRASIRYHVNRAVSVWGAVGSGFRAPTLNELYRDGRVGSVRTIANSDLGPERLVSFEGGATVEVRPDLVWRATVFDSRVSHAVSNITIGQSGADITQKRQNLGRTHSRGLETDLEYRIGSLWRMTGAYLFGESTVSEFTADPTLVGKWLVQVPRHRASAQVVYSNPRLVDVSFSLQAVGLQYDDDQNIRGIPGNAAAGLPGYAIASLSAARRLDRNTEVFVGAQNLFDQRYFVGTLPSLVGPPRMISAGVRVNFRGR